MEFQYKSLQYPDRLQVPDNWNKLLEFSVLMQTDWRNSGLMMLLLQDQHPEEWPVHWQTYLIYDPCLKFPTLFCFP